jgi:hypothetical protein
MARRLDTRRTIGGILKLKELIFEHGTAFAYDFRSKFGVSYLEIGYSVSWLEALRLTAGLMQDTDSKVQAAVNKWDYPIRREFMVLANIYDLLAAVNSKKKPKPYPMPWPDPNKQKIGSTKIQPRKTIIDKLDRMNPSKE